MYKKIGPDLAILFANSATGSFGGEFIKFLAFFPMLEIFSGSGEFIVANITNFNIGGRSNIGRHSGLKVEK